MAVMVIAEVPGQTEPGYDGMLELLAGSLRRAEGFVLHTAHPVEGGWRITEVWQSRDVGQPLLREERRPESASRHSPETLGPGAAQPADPLRIARPPAGGRGKLCACPRCGRARHSHRWKTTSASTGLDFRRVSQSSCSPSSVRLKIEQDQLVSGGRVVQAWDRSGCKAHETSVFSKTETDRICRQV